jgi:ribosomal-protein-alanine N-acetyltransferase
MRVEHIPAVAAIEKLSFTQPWPRQAYRKEIVQNRMAYYYVAKRLDALGLTSAELGLEAAGGEQPTGLVGRFTRLFKPTQEPVQPGSEQELSQIVGYAGLWLMVDEAHVTTIAVHPRYRGEGVGELLLVQMIDTALSIDAHWLTLEVRKSNLVAQKLYHKYTFREMGMRRRYYSDNGEDALVMWTDALDSETFAEALRRNRSSLEARFAQSA